MFRRRSERNRPMVLPKPFPVYDRARSMYPDHLKVSFSNGKVLIYDVRVESAKPCFSKPEIVVEGYVYKGGVEIENIESGS